MPEPMAIFIHPALLPGSSAFFSCTSSGSDDDGAGTPQLLQVRVEVPPSTAGNAAAPLLEHTPSPDAGSSRAAVAFVLVFWAIVIAGLVYYWRFF